MPVTLTDNVNEMKQKKVELINEARDYYKQNIDEWGAEHKTVLDRRKKDIQDLNDHVQKLESVESAGQDLSALEAMMEGAGTDGELTPKPGQSSQFKNVDHVEFRCGEMGNHLPYKANKTASPEYRSAFRDYCNLQQAPITSHPDKTFHNVMQYGGIHGDQYMTAPMQFHSEFLKGCDQVSVLRQLANVIPMSTVGDLGIRKRTKKTASFAWGCACARPTADEPGIGLRSMSLSQASFASCVCRDLLRRTDGFNVEQFIADELARDAGDNLEQAYMLGDGVKKPLGIFTASDDGISTDRDVESGVVGGVLADDLIRMKMSLCITCRQGPSSSRLSWIFPTGMLTQIMLMTDGNGQYLWRPGLTQGHPDVILGHRVYETNVFTADISTGNYVGIFGDFNRYWILDGPSIGLERDLEIFDDQVCWVGRTYTDGMPIEEDCFARLIVQ